MTTVVYIIDMSQERHTHEKLMASYKAGDFGAFEKLYQICSPKVYAYLKSKMRGSPDIDDVFQQVFIKFHKSRDQYDPKYLLDQWLFVICRSVLLDHYKKTNKSIEDLSQDYQEPSYTPQIEEDLSPPSDLKLEQLTEEQKKVVEGKVLDELAYSEIAEKLKKSEATIRQIFSRAIKRLKTANEANHE